MSSMEQQKQDALKEMETVKDGMAQKSFEREKELVILKEEERRKTAVAVAAITGASFNPEADADKDGENDFLEIARKGLETQIKASKQQLEEKKYISERGDKEKEFELKKEELAIKKEAAKHKASSTSK